MSIELSSLAVKPVLTEVIIKDAKIVKKYGQEISFWTMKPLSMKQFGALAQADQEDFEQMFTLLSPLMLDKAGKEIMDDGKELPDLSLFTAALKEITSGLGK